MALSVSLALFAGMLLGYWFRLLILIPVIALALVGVIGAGRARADDAWSIGLTALGLTIVLQIGYLIGSGLRDYGITRKAAGLAQSPSHPAPIGDTAKKDGPAGQDADNQPKRPLEETH